MNAPEALSPSGTATGPRWLEPTQLESLGPAFHTELPPQPLNGLHWVARNGALAAELGLDGWIGSADALQLLGGTRQPPVGRSRASVYSGHQFGIWAGQLGDGRALTLGEVPGPGGPVELQLKGSGRTPYSRMGDGRAVLRSSIREYLCSEAMHALGIPTTRALAVVGSPDPVQRETVETAAVVTRVAPSFLRFGHFEHFTHTAGDTALLQRLADAVIDRFYPECRDAPQPVLDLLAEVSRRTARLLADWQCVGFCHGVMNTDNMSILGLTIDYGPYGFLDAFDPGHVCNHSDHQGRYAYFRQPSIAFWNLHALAHALAPLADGDGEALQSALEPYKDEFAAAMQQRMRAKLGLQALLPDDAALADDLMKAMARDRVDFTIAWRRLCDHDPAQPDAPGSRAMRDLFIDREAFDAWSAGYGRRLAQEAGDPAARRDRMRRVNPKFVLRNHLAETAIRSAREGDFAEVDRLMRVLARPFDEQPGAEAYAAFPPDWASQLEVSCSS